MITQLSLFPAQSIEKLIFIRKGNLYLSIGDRWTKHKEWAMKFTHFEAMRKRVELSLVGIKTYERKENIE